MENNKKIGLIMMGIGVLCLLIYVIGTIHNTRILTEYGRQANIYMDQNNCSLENLILCEIQNKTVYKFDCIQEEIPYICGKIKPNKPKQWEIKIN
jgi:hypothetical protein